MQEWFALVSGVIVLAGAPFYLYDIVKGTTKPHRITWLIWSIQGVVAFTSQALLGGHWSLVYIGLEAAGNIVVFLLSLHYGVGGWARIDKLALLIALVGVIVSVIARRPVIAIAGVIMSDLAGIALTLRKVYRQPGSETAITWLALGTASLLSAFAVGRWSPSLLLYPVYLAVSCYAVLFVMLTRRTLRPKS